MTKVFGFNPIVAALLLTMTSSLWIVTSSAEEYVGQLRIYVDQMGANHWKRVTGKSHTWDFWVEMNSTVFEINQIFKTMEGQNVNLRLHIDDVVFLDQNILRTNNNGKIINKQALSQFENWVSPSYSNRPYDLSILFTGANLVEGNWADNSYGYARIGTACSAAAVGVVELRATYNDVLAAAHEIGHIFGADHDGDKSATRCSVNSGHVMNAVTKNESPNHFSFSSCSATSIRDVINNLNNNGNNCLARWYRAKEISGPRFVSLMTPDQICKRKYGDESYIARKAYGSYGDAVCTQVACMTSTVGTYFYWTYQVTPPGLKCGKNKECVQGKCVTTPGGSDQVSDRCPFGDQPKIEGDFRMTCADDMTSSKCSTWNKTCCHTCADPGTADQVCRDLQGKSSAMARRAYNTSSFHGYGDQLCSKLACLTSTVSTYFTWNYYKAPDGMKCGKNKRCDDGKCLPHKLGDPGMSDSCPYGDQPWLGGDWQRSCADQIRQNGCSERGWNETCCASCSDPGTADEICQRLEGSYSVMARRAYSRYGNDLCSQLACMSRVSGTMLYWNTYTAPDGMKCGKNRRCLQGQCVWTRHGDPSVSDWCPYGDQPWLGGAWQMTCPDYVAKNGCSGNGWSQTCCSSC